MTTTPIRRGVSCAITVAAWLLLMPALHACPVCFQVEDGPAAAGVRAAVVVLLGVTGSVLAGAGLFVVRFARRSARARGEAAE
jgi:hypothetical protein